MPLYGAGAEIKERSWREFLSRIRNNNCREKPKLTVNSEGENNFFFNQEDENFPPIGQKVNATRRILLLHIKIRKHAGEIGIVKAPVFL